MMFLAHSDHVAHFHVGELILYVAPIIGIVAAIGGVVLFRMSRRQPNENLQKGEPR